MSKMLEASVDWCESNYSTSEHIAEFWNTISGVCIGISSLVFHVKCYQYDYVPRQLQRVVVLLYTVSMGTMLFHGTLLYPFQLLDELPMLMIAMQYLEFVQTLRAHTNHTNHTIHKRNLEGSLLIVIALGYFVHPLLQQFIFHVSLKLYEANLIYELAKMAKTLNGQAFSALLPFAALCSNKKGRVQLFRYISLRKDTSHRIRVATFFYITSMVLWFFDQVACQHVEFLKLHAIWHFLSSVGVYQLNMIMLNHHHINKMIHSI